MRALIILLLFCSYWLQAQELPLISQQSLQQDFKIFKESVLQIHGGLYWYNDSTTIEHALKEIESSLNKDMSAGAFYQILQPFYASLGCGHSWISMPSSWRKLLDSHYRFPFYMYFENDRLILIKDMTPEGNLNVGWELDSINGESAFEVYKSLWKYAPSDGYNQTHRAETILWNFDRYYQTFKPLSNTLHVVLKNPADNSRQNYTISCLPKNVRDSTHLERYPMQKAKPSPLFFQIQDEVAYLRIKGFTTWETNVKSSGYKKFLRKTFSDLKDNNTNKLIVDLRGNGGGKDRWGAWLCRYLINEDFKYFEKMEARTRNFDFKENSSNKGLNLVGMLFKKNNTNPDSYSWTHHNPLKTQKSNKNAFSGELVLLIDGATFSTAADVASVVSSNTDATFIGEEVGGGYYGNTSAISYSMNLKASNIWYQIPVVRYTTATTENRPKGHGVTPDIEVENKYEDWLKNRDAVLEVANDYLSTSGQ